MPTVRATLQQSQFLDSDDPSDPIHWTASALDPDPSMWSQAESLDSSSIRMCIGASHSYSNDYAIDKVSLFDLLVVRIGHVPPFDLDSESEQLLPDFPPLHLKITRPSCASGDWLTVPMLPSRVVDVGMPNERIDCRIVPGRGQSARYVAFSHCWGGPISVLLKVETLDAFQIRLPDESLPLNFRDAITVTRNLGIRYIWIDSLYIVQDSKADWEAASKKMATIHRNSTITLASSASRHSQEGFLRAHRHDNASTARIPLSLLPTSQSLNYFEVKPLDVEVEILASLDLSGPLSSRAWTFQESAMSSRMLYYGHRQIYWRCSAGFQCVEDIPHGRGHPEFLYAAGSAVLCHTRDDFRTGSVGTNTPTDLESEAIFEDYYRMVQDYSGRKLTFDSDKLPAFSGLAICIQPAVKSQYLAGLWLCDVPRGLFWAREFIACQHISQYRAPS